MAHPRWPGLNTKTGNPTVDNAARTYNRRLWRSTQKALRIRAAGRKRRKQLLRVEGGNYIRLVVTVSNQLARERATASKP